MSVSRGVRVIRSPGRYRAGDDAECEYRYQVRKTATVTEAPRKIRPVYRPATVYGVPREFVRAAERPDIPPQDHSKRSAARQQRLDTVAAMVATYPDSTARELCEVTGFGHPAMQDYLRTLREDGVVEITIPDQIGYSGKRPYTFHIRGAT